MTTHANNNQLTIKKSTIAILTRQATSNATLAGLNGHGSANRTTKTTVPPDTETCIGCNSLVPDGCNTAICGMSL